MVMRDRIGAGALALLLTYVAAAAQSSTMKPRPPVGVDPGGTAIGLITTGIDYTLPHVARCLARDGEGRLIAWDAVDRDPLPYRPSTAGMFDDNTLILAVNCEGRARIVIARVDPANPISFSRALAFLATTPARIIVLPARNAPVDWGPFAMALAAFKQLHVAVATIEQAAPHPASAQPNVTLLPAATADQASLIALAHVVMLVACNAKARDTSLDGAALASLMTEQLIRSPAAPVGTRLLQKCL